MEVLEEIPAAVTAEHPHRWLTIETTKHRLMVSKEEAQGVLEEVNSEAMRVVALIVADSEEVGT